MKNKESELVMSVISLHAKIQKRIGGALSIHGLGLSEFLVLYELNIAPNQKMRRVDLAERVGLSPSGVTRLLNPMEKIGLIKKEANPRDARVSLVALSTSGSRVVEEAQNSFDHVATALFDSISAKKQAVLSELISSVV